MLACLLAACQKSGGENPQPTPEALRPAPEDAAPAAPAQPAPGELLAVGASVPRVSGTAHTGEKVDLGALEGRPAVVYFYPKDDTPGCTVEAQEIRDLWTELQGTGAVVIGVSTDDTTSHQAFADKHALPFLLLPDTDHRVAKAFGVPLENGRARRVTFVIDKSGKVAKVFPEVKPRGHARELLATLRGLG